MPTTDEEPGLGTHAVVLGAGGVAGWGLHFGAAQALEEAGLGLASASRVVGTSAGAAVAASVLGGVTAERAVREVLRPPTEEERREYLAQVRERNRRRSWWPAAPWLWRALLPGGAGAGVAWAGLAPAGVFPGESLTRFPGLDHDRWPDPLRIVAVRLDDGARVVFGAPDAPATTVARAVQASQSVPLMFAPTEIGDARYVDGATWSSTHADLLLDDPPDVAVVVAPMARDGRGFAGRLARARARAELPALAAAGTEVVAVRPGPELDPLFAAAARRDPDLGTRLVAAGRSLVNRALRDASSP